MKKKKKMCKVVLFVFSNITMRKSPIWLPYEERKLSFFGLVSRVVNFGADPKRSAAVKVVVGLAAAKALRGNFGITTSPHSVAV